MPSLLNNAESMSDTRELSHQDLEDIVVSLRKQPEDNDQGFMVDEHMASMSDESDYESDKTGQVLVVAEHIVPMANPHWRGDYEFSDTYDDEDSLWLSAMAGAVSNIGETELPSPVMKPITLPRDAVEQWGDASICWYSVLRACWTEAKLLPAQCQLRRSWLVALVLRQWIKCLMDRHQ